MAHVKDTMDRILRLNEFFVEGGKQNVSHVLLHITEPSTPEEMHKGYFFAVCEINQAETKYITRLQELIDQAENDYYEIADTESKTSLELVLEKMNQEALTLVSSGVALNCVIGAIRQPEVIFTYYGKPHILVFYKNAQGAYQVMNLTDRQENEQTQLFSHIIQGKISANDYLFVGTPHIGEYFSHDRLQKIITSRPAVQSAQHIERVLSEIKNGFSFGGMIIHIDRADSGPVPIKRMPSVVKGASTKSLQSIFNRERSTANTLSPSLFPRLNDRMKSFLNRGEETQVATEVKQEVQMYKPAEINASHISHRNGNSGSIRDHEKNTNESPSPLLKNVVAFFIKAGLMIVKVIWFVLLFIYTFFYSLFRNSILLFFVITNYQNRRKHIQETWKKQWHSYKENIRQLPFITKALFISSIVIAALFVGSIFTIRYQKQQAAHAKVFNDTVQQIRAKSDAMESALIYKDDQAAFAELASAQELLKNLACESKEEKATCETLNDQLNLFTSRIRKVTEVKPEVLHTWNISEPIENIIKIDTKLIGFSSQTSTLFVYDQLTNEEKIIPAVTGVPGFNKASVPKENDYIILSFNQKEFVKFDPATMSANIITVNFPNEVTNVADFVVYNRRLYTLDTINNQIYRHDSTKSGFDQGKDWVKDGTLVKDGQELTIDGDMFVLKNNGDFVKFTSGISQPFSILGLEPGIGQNASVWTYTDQNYLYITDPSQRRLVILEKDGRIKQQLTASGFIKPFGLAVDSTNNTAFVVDSNRLLKIDLPQ